MARGKIVSFPCFLLFLGGGNEETLVRNTKGLAFTFLRHFLTKKPKVLVNLYFSEAFLTKEPNGLTFLLR